MIQILHALTIGTVKYGDSSLIVNCFTLEFGLQSYMLKGILTSKKNQKISKSYFEPLTLLEIQAPQNQENKLGFIKEVKLEYAYQSLPFDMKKKAVLFFLAEVIQQVVREEPHENSGLYRFFKSRLLWLDVIEKVNLFHIKFMLDLTQHIGFYPNLENSHFPFFDLASGCMSHVKTKVSIEGENKMYWETLLGMKFDDQTKLNLGKEEKSKLLQHAITYFELHLQQFKSPKSLKVLHEVFSTS